MSNLLLRFLFCATCVCILCSCERGDAPISPTEKKATSTSLRILTWPLSAPVTSFDPIDATNLPEATVARQLFDTLVRLDKDLSLSPGIARKWEIDPSGKEYTFHIKAGQVFHNGSALTAVDVKRSLERVAKTGKKTFLYKHLKIIEGFEAFSQGQVDSISGIQVVSPLQVRIRLNKPHAPFLPALSIYQAAIISTSEANSHKENTKLVVGSGPFILESADERHIVLRPFIHFIDNPPRIDKLVFKIYAGADIKRAAEDFLSGYLSAVPLATPVKEMFKGKTDYKVIRRYMTGLFFYGFNMRKEGRLDASLRRRIAQLIDKHKMLASLNPDKSLAADRIIPIGLAGYRPYPITSAASQVSEDTQTIPISVRMLSAARNPVVEAEMTYLAGRLRMIGIELHVKYVLDWNVFYERLAAGDCDMFRLAWYPDTPDLDEMFFPLFHSQGEYNYFGYANKHIDELLEKARALVRLEDRIPIYQEIEDILLSDLPAIPISYEALDRAVKPNVHGLDWTFLGELYTSFASVWIE